MIKIFAAHCITWSQTCKTLKSRTCKSFLCSSLLLLCKKIRVTPKILSILALGAQSADRKLYRIQKNSVLLEWIFSGALRNALVSRPPPPRFFVTLRNENGLHPPIPLMYFWTVPYLNRDAFMLFWRQGHHFRAWRQEGYPRKCGLLCTLVCIK